MFLSKIAIAAALLFAVAGSANSLRVSPPTLPSSLFAYFVEIDHGSATKLDQPSLQEVSKFTASHIKSALQKIGFERPVEIGRNCFAGQ